MKAYFCFESYKDIESKWANKTKLSTKSKTKIEK